MVTGSLNEQACVALVDNIVQRPKRGKKGQGGKGEDGRGQDKKGKSGQGKTDDGKGKGKGGKWQAREAFERPRVVKAKVRAVSMNPRQVDQKTLRCGFCSFGNQCGDWKWNNCREVTFTLDSGTAVSAARQSLEDDFRCKLKNRDRTRQRRKNLCKRKD